MAERKLRIKCLGYESDVPLAVLRYEITFPDGRKQFFSTGSWKTLWNYVSCYLNSGDPLYLSGIAWP